jgi:hypothetical protein
LFDGERERLIKTPELETCEARGKAEYERQSMKERALAKIQ